MNVKIFEKVYVLWSCSNYVLHFKLSLHCTVLFLMPDRLHMKLCNEATYCFPLNDDGKDNHVTCMPYESSSRNYDRTQSHIFAKKCLDVQHMYFFRASGLLDGFKDKTFNFFPHPYNKNIWWCIFFMIQKKNKKKNKKKQQKNRTKNFDSVTYWRTWGSNIRNLHDISHVTNRCTEAWRKVIN